MKQKGFKPENGIIDKILQCIKSGNNVLLVGGYATGKTTRLKLLVDLDFLSKKGISTRNLLPVFIPIRETLPFNANKLYRRILETVAEDLENREASNSLLEFLQKVIRRPERINYVDFEEVIGQLRNENLSLLILIDDIDLISDYKDLDFYDGLRHLITQYSTIFVISTHQQLYRLISSREHYSSPFYNTFVSIAIPGKEEKTTESFVEGKSDYEQVNTQFLLDLIAEEISIDKDDLGEKSPEEQYEYLIEHICDKFVGNEAGFGIISDLIKFSKPLDFVLHLTEKRYRDHRKHQFDVGVLGWFLLNTFTGTEELKMDICELYSWDEKDVARAWFTTAFLHDHAYPISYLLDMAPKLHHLKEDFTEIKEPIKQIQSAYEKAYFNLFSHDLYDYLKIIFENGENISRDLMRTVKNDFDLVGIDVKLRDEDIYDHGVLGALNIIKKLENNLDHLKESAIRKAIEAIALHNLPYHGLTIKEKPLATLLVLCDEIQEWERNMMIRHEYVTELDHVSIGPFEEKVGNRTFLETFNIKFEYDDFQKLSKTKWSFDIFCRSKMEQFRRLGLFSEDDERNPKKLKYEVTMPFSPSDKLQD